MYVCLVRSYLDFPKLEVNWAVFTLQHSDLSKALGQIFSKKSEWKEKPAMKSFSKNLSLGVDFKLQVSPLLHKTNCIEHKRCEKLGRFPDYPV